MKRLGVLITVTLIALTTPVLPTAPARADSVTAAADNLRTGWYNNQPSLTPAVVGGSSFGQVFSTAITGQVYAQPLVASNTLIVATETNDVYGIDPATGATRWHRNFGAPWNPLDIGCGDLTPSIGITGTPAIDPATGTAYFLAKNYASGTSGPAQYVAHAVDVLNGNERPGFPLIIAGTPTNAPGATFNATYELQRPGLLLMNGVIYAAFGGHCDFTPYRGLVVGITTSGVMKTMWAAESSATNGGGIWMAGAPLMSDGPGQMYLATGNGGDAPPVGSGLGATPSLGFSDSVVRLTVQSDGSLKATDFFTPFNADTLSQNDQDFGSGGTVGLPDSFGTAEHPHLLVVAGKEGYVYLLDRDNLGGRSNATDNVLGKFGPFGGVWSKPAVWPGDGGYVYLPSASPGTGAGGSSGFFRVYQRVLDGAGNPALSLAATSSDAFGFGSSPPIVTSNGTTSGSALVWIVHTDGGSGTNAQLRAYDAVPNGGALTLRFAAPIGTASKFTAPVVDNGRVFVGTRDGHVLGFGQTGAGPALSGPSLAFAATTTGTSRQASVTLTAARATNVSAVSIDNPAFTLAAATTPPLPVALPLGGTITVPVTFTPTQLGPVTGTLSVTTDSGVSTVPVSGTGQAPTVPIGTSPSSVNFGTVPGGSQTVSSSVTFTNTGTTAQTVQSVKLPASPFGVTGAPAAGSMIAPGASVAITVSFAPPDQSGTSPTPYVDTLGITTDQASAAVPLAGTTALPANLVLPGSVPFGNVGLGSTATLSFTVSNSGGSPMTILKSKPPVVAGFAATSTLAEGTVIPGGTSLTETVTFTPATLGPATAAWTITADDGSGLQNVGFTATGVASTAIPSPGTGWQFNGSAAMSTSTLNLTTATPNQAGSAFYPTPVSSSSLDVSFTSTIGGGSGADGLTLALIDPNNGATALGAPGGGLGFSGLQGVAVAVDTYPNVGVTSPNFVGVAKTTVGGPAGALTFLATNTTVPILRGTSHGVHVTVNAGLLTVALDGTTVLQTQVALPPAVLVGFTGGTGGLTDVHSVSNVNISTVPAAPSSTIPAPPSGWKLNGKAKMVNNTILQLTPASTFVAGSAWYTTPVQTDGLDISFTSTMNGGTGGTGTALVFADPSTSTSYVGANGAALGFAGASATAVILNTYQSSGAPAANFVAIGTSALNSGSPKWLMTSTNVPNLRSGSHLVHVSIASNVLTMAIDGTRTVQARVTLPPTVLLGFSGSTGKLTDLHQVSAVSIKVGPSGAAPPAGPSVLAPPPTGWQLNGLASIVGSTSLQLTPPTGSGAGSAFATRALSTASKVTISFTAAIDSGTGADGMCLVLADASQTQPTALGQAGGGLGFSGIPGTCIGLQTFQGATDPSNNFVGVGRSGPSGSVTWSATNTNIAALRGTPHDFVVMLNAGLLTVVMDGAQVLTTAITAPPQILLGFTGGSGGLTDRHAVSNINVTLG